MGGQSKNFNIEDLISYGDDLINVLNVKNEFGVLEQSFQHLKAIQFTCDEDFNEIQGALEDCKKRLDACKKKTEEADSGTAVEYKIERLQKELEEETERECKLKEELRVVADELKELNAQSTLIEEQREAMKRKERDDSRAQKKLSMYASVTKVIPDIDDPSKISGYMVDREKRVIEKFEFKKNEMSAYETCNSIWSFINKH